LKSEISNVTDGIVVELKNACALPNLETYTNTDDAKMALMRAIDHALHYTDFRRVDPRKCQVQVRRRRGRGRNDLQDEAEDHPLPRAAAASSGHAT